MPARPRYAEAGRSPGSFSPGACCRGQGAVNPQEGARPPGPGGLGFLVEVEGIEPSSSACRTGILPLNYTPVRLRTVRSRPRE